MSVITEVLIIPGCENKRSYQENAKLWEELLKPLAWAGDQRFGCITEMGWVRTKGSDVNTATGPGGFWGGGKVPTGDICAAAFNHLPWQGLVWGPDVEGPDGFVDWVTSLPWKAPEQVRILTEREHPNDRTFQVWILRAAPFENEGPTLKLVSILDGMPW